MNRREFFNLAKAAAAVPFFAKLAHAQSKPAGNPAGPVILPTYLEAYKDLYLQDPHQAALKWFSEARFGLFITFGISSQLEKGEWVMYFDKIPVAEYMKLKDTFKPDKFDADFITDLACESGMTYVNLITKHHDGFCLFETAASDYHSVNSPAKRDLVAELASECRKKKLGFFVYYSYSADWQHPYFYPSTFSRHARPLYPEPDPSYKWQKDEDFQYYIEDAHTHIRELLTNYGPVAGIWFDPLLCYYGRYDLFPIEQTYTMIRNLQPQALISFKQGATGTEDFAAPERKSHCMADRVRKEFGELAGELATKAWEGNKDKHNEICDTLQNKAWGYHKEAIHKTPPEVVEILANAARQNCNLLLNTGPLPDGSIHPEDIATLRGIGKHIRSNGWPV